MDCNEFLRQNRAVLEQDTRYEVLFVEKVLCLVRDLDFSNVSCQTQFTDGEGVKRRIDFTVSEGTEVRLALEVDGWDKRGRGSGMSPTEFEEWSRRELEMSSQKWVVLRFANSLVIHDARACARHLELVLSRERRRARGRSASSEEIRSLNADEKLELDELERTRQDALEALNRQLEQALEGEEKALEGQEKAREGVEKAREGEEKAREGEEKAREGEARTERDNLGMGRVAVSFAVVVVTFVVGWVIVDGRRESNRQDPPGLEATLAGSEFCPGGANWSEAGRSVGRSGTFVGRVIGVRYLPGTQGQPTYINIGLPFPDPARLTVLIWGRSRNRFSTAPEQLYAGKTLCVSGEVELYEGSPQIEVTSPSVISSQ